MSDSLITPGMAVPAVDSVVNTNWGDAVGNKSDTIDGDSLMAFVKLIKSEHIASGTSPNTAGTTNTSISIELDAGASAVDGAYDPAVIYILSGTGAGQARQIWQYVGATKLAYVNRDWKVTPDDTSVYCIVMNPGDTHVNEGLAQGGAASSITLNTLASSQNNVYLGQMVFIAAGTGADQGRMCIGYNGTTKVLTVDSAWIVQPDNTSVYAMYPWPGFVFGVPAIDSAANVLSRDVLGQKGDTHNGDSAMAVLHTTDEHFHSVSKTYPMLKDGIILTAAAGDWELGASVTIIGNIINLDNAAAADQGGAPNVVRIPATGHGLIATFDYVTIAGTVNYNGTFQVVAVSDANHFDIESAFTAETFAGGGAETATDVVPEDFDIHDILIEAMSNTGKTYQLIFYRADTDAVICTTRAQIGANKADSSGSKIQTILIPALTGVYGKIAIEDGDNTATIQLSFRYHTY